MGTGRHLTDTPLLALRQLASCAKRPTRRIKPSSAQGQCLSILHFVEADGGQIYQCPPTADAGNITVSKQVTVKVVKPR